MKFITWCSEPCPVSFDMPEYTGDVTGLGTLRLLEPFVKPASRRNSIRLPQAKCSALLPSPERADALPASESLCRCQGLCLLRRPELPDAYKIFACNVSCLTMNPAPGGNLCYPQGNPRGDPIKLGFRINCISATSMQNGIGGLREITWRPCGSCSSRKSR